MIAFINEHRAVHGVEPICKVLPIAPSTYRLLAARRGSGRTGDAGRSRTPVARDGGGRAISSVVMPAGQRTAGRDIDPTGMAEPGQAPG